MKRITSFMFIAALFFAGVGMIAFLIESRATTLSKVHFIAAGVCLAIYFVTNAKEIITTLRQRTTRFGALVSVYTIIVFAVVAVVNIFGALTSRQVADFTEKGLYTLAPQTDRLLSGLEDNLKIYAFFRGGRSGLEEVRPVDRLLASMASISRKVTIEPVDPYADPLLAEKMKVVSNGVVVLEYKGKTEKVNVVTEQNVTNAMIRLFDSRKKTLCFTTGHGEPAIEGPEAMRGNYAFGRLNQFLKSMGYFSRSLDMNNEQRIPEECTVVMVAGQKTPFSDGELVLMDGFLRKGGRVFIATDAAVETHLDPLLERWGVRIGKDLIVDRVVQGTIVGDEGFKPTSVKPTFTIEVSDYESGAIVTQDMSVTTQTQFLAARSMQPYASSTPEMKVTPLLRTKKESWAEKDVLQTLSASAPVPPTLSVESGDVVGPITLAVSSTLNVQSTAEPLRGYSYQARLIAVGNAYWLSNAMLDPAKNFNTDLISGMVGFLAGLEQYLPIPPKYSSGSTLILRPDQKYLLFDAIIIIIPEILLMLGALVWWLRR